MTTLAEAPAIPAGVEYRPFSCDLELARDANGEQRIVKGIAVPWDEWIDVYGDGWMYESFRSGVIDHQLRELQRIKTADRHMYRGGTLIGVTRTAKNDAKGLYWEGLVAKTPSGDHALELVRNGALDQLSVGFRERADGNEFALDPLTNKPSKNRVIRVKVDMFEVALVPEGAYGKGAAVLGLRERPVGAAALPDEPSESEEIRAYLVGRGYDSEAVGRALAALRSMTDGLDEVEHLLAKYPPLS